MRKFLLSMALVFCTAGAMAQGLIEFTFTRNGNGATVNVNGAENVTATIEATSASNAWNTGGNMATATNILCQNTNTNATSVSSPITFTLTISGIDAEQVYNNVLYTHVAVNSSGNYQPANNQDTRHCNFILNANDSDLETKTDINIWIPQGKSENTITFENKEIKANADGTITLKLTLYKGTTNNGCFYGLKSITLATDAAIEAAAVEEWKTNNTTIFGYVGAYPESAREDAEGVASYSDIEAFEAANEKIAVSTDSYYRIVNVSPKSSGSADNKVLAFNGDSKLITTPADKSSINQIFKFEDAGDGKFYLKSLNADGYLNKISSGSYRASIETQSNACKLELQAYEALAQWKLHNSESTDTNHSLFAENNESEGFACSGWNGGANSASAWYIIPAEDVEITVNEYATVYLPFAVSVEGATAYAVEETNSTHAILTEKTDIPANEGAILAAEGEAIVTLNILAEAESDWTNNNLQGTTTDTEIIKEEGNSYYILANKNGVGFYNAVLDADETKFKNAANKAYLVVPTTEDGAEVASYSFRFGEGTTGIDEVKGENGNVKAIFDLTGRRVQNITEPGIYIVGGAKKLVR